MGVMSWMGSFVKMSDRRKMVWRMSMEDACATCSVVSLDGVQGECPPAAEGNGNLTRQGGTMLFIRKKGHPYNPPHCNGRCRV